MLLNFIGHSFDCFAVYDSVDLSAYVFTKSALQLSYSMAYSHPIIPVDNG